MTLTCEDANRIDALGYNRKDYLLHADDGFSQLTNVDGHCYFYDSEAKMCRIYESRPEGCRYYPVIYDARKRKCVVDKDCTSASTISRDEIRKVCHKVRAAVALMVREAAHGESPR
jgi:Fe-S-cluster containining protein